MHCLLQQKQQLQLRHYSSTTSTTSTSVGGEPLIGQEQDTIIIDDATPIYQQQQHHHHHCHHEHHENHEISNSSDGNGNSGVAIGKIDLYMAAQFKCGKCQTHNSHVFLKKTYEEGQVIVRCPGCKNLHLIADNKGWFGDERNVEQILRAQGKKVRHLSANEVMQLATGNSPFTAAPSSSSAVTNNGVDGDINDGEDGAATQIEFTAEHLAQIQDAIDRRVARTRERILAEEEKLKKILRTQQQQQQDEEDEELLPPVVV